MARSDDIILHCRSKSIPSRPRPECISERKNREKRSDPGLGVPFKHGMPWWKENAAF